MKLPVVGYSYQERSLPFANDRTINLYPVPAEGNAREAAMLLGTPGLSSFATCGAGPNRGEFACDNGRGFVVSGNTLYELDSSGTETVRGVLNTQNGGVTMDENGDQLAICDGEDLYIFTFATDTFAEVTDGDFPGAGSVTEMDGYFIINDPDTGQFYISALRDGTSWDALDFATAEGLPDNIVRVFAAYGILWVLGTRSTEPYQNSGASDFPFSRLSSTRSETGCAAAQTVATLDNSVFWLGRDKDGNCIVYRSNGSSPVRVSTHAIESKLQALSNPSVLRAWTYQKDGHAFYVLTGGALETSLVYDASTQAWHERAYLNGGELEQHLAVDSMFCFGFHLVADRRNGNIYKLLDSVYTDNGDYIRRQRNFKGKSDEDQEITLNRLGIKFESGTGISTGQGSAPVAMLSISNDGGRTYGNEESVEIGAMGEYVRAEWRCLGTAEDWDFELAISDPVKVAIIGAYAS